MLFSAKQKGFFVEQGPDTVLIARTSSLAAPMLVEEVRECAIGDEEALANAIAELQPKPSPSGYLHSVCGIYTPKRLIRRVSLEAKRLKEENYFSEIISQQLRVEPDSHTMVVLNANDGSDFVAGRPIPQKEVLFAGMPKGEIKEAQNALLEAGIYPERLEIGSLSALGGLVSFLSSQGNKTPTLVLEVGPDVTHSYIVSVNGVEASRPIAQGYESMLPVVQKELGLKDEEAARKLFFSDTFDFTGMGPALIKKLMKELHSSIGFYEVQTGQSVGFLYSLLIPPKLKWLDASVATALGVSTLDLDLTSWLKTRQITLSESVQNAVDARWLGLFSLMINHNAETPNSDAHAEKEN